MNKIIIFAVVFLISSACFGQSNSSLRYSATVSSTPIVVSVLSGAIYENLQPGFGYRTLAAEDPMNLNITQVNGNEVFTPAAIEIEGAPNSEVVVTFVLPSRLLPYDAVW